MSKKRKGKNRVNRLEAFKQKLYSDKLFAGQEIVIQPGSGEKMSEVLLAFIEPYQKLAPTREAYEKLITVAMVAWNAALLPKDKREGFLDEEINPVLSSLGHKAVQDFKAIVNELIKRKERLFPNNRRFIVSYELSETKDNYHLSVASTIHKDEADD